MVSISIVYEGELHCRLIHEPSGTVIATDAPKDNHGKGESFSPTDLVAAALGSCMLTLMGIFADRRGLKLSGTQVEVAKEMAQEPFRKIGKLSVTFQFPAGIPKNDRQALERAGLTCPVHKSLHPDISIPAVFLHPD